MDGFLDIGPVLLFVAYFTKLSVSEPNSIGSRMIDELKRIWKKTIIA
jgi:hypothetical protein